MKTPGVILATQKDARRLSGAGMERARRWLMEHDPRLGALIERVGPCRLADSARIDPFAGLVRVILSQQLSVSAANTIHGRVVALAGSPPELTPARVLALEAAALRSAGVSRPKIAYLHGLAARVADGRLDLPALRRLQDDDVIEAITSVKGLGRWSAEMYLIFRLNRPDVWPIGDLGIVKGVQKLFEMRRPPAPRTMERLAKPWRPYRSVAAWYLWRIHELE
jgi:DNA-3-methyladenine glycosylase II